MLNTVTIPSSFRTYSDSEEKDEEKQNRGEEGDGGISVKPQEYRQHFIKNTVKDL